MVEISAQITGDNLYITKGSDAKVMAKRNLGYWQDRVMAGNIWTTIGALEAVFFTQQGLGEIGHVLGNNFFSADNRIGDFFSVLRLPHLIAGIGSLALAGGALGMIAMSRKISQEPRLIVKAFKSPERYAIMNTTPGFLRR